MLTSRGPTGWEVARAANVSQSTVSLVLSGRAGGRVSPATQERVRRVAKELGYRPHAAARSLRLGRSGLVLLVAPDVRDPLFAGVVDGAGRAAHENGCSVVLAANQNGALLGGAASAVDGVVVCAKPSRELTGSGGQLPMIVLDATAPRGVPAVRLDVADGMSRAVRRLIELGHRHIGYLHAPNRPSRWAAFKRAAADVRATTVTARLTAEAAERAGRELLSDPDGRVTAIVCDGDEHAAGLYRAAYGMGLRIPEDLSVIGFGGTGLGELLSPPLTTVELPGEELGRTGVVMLLGLLAGQPPVQRALLPMTLRERHSTAPPPS
ncbi:MAG TPA: LacI family DNA-binding transcriptional regulator [Pseudonocardiaceae bacterium]|nr:LacI family DNA-binding transcriptional regulator [Pseudonocardiaceae bacterium]